MKWFDNFRIAPKLLLGFGIALVALVATNIFGLYNMAEVNKKSSDIKDKWLPSITRTANMMTALSNHRYRRSATAWTNVRKPKPRTTRKYAPSGTSVRE